MFIYLSLYLWNLYISSPTIYGIYLSPLQLSMKSISVSLFIYLCNLYISYPTIYGIYLSPLQLPMESISVSLFIYLWNQYIYISLNLFMTYLSISLSIHGIYNDLPINLFMKSIDVCPSPCLPISMVYLFTFLSI